MQKNRREVLHFQKAFAIIIKLIFGPGPEAAHGPVAQLDRVFDYESKGRGFESRRAHQGSSCKAASFFAFSGRKQWYLTNYMTKYSIFRHCLPLPSIFLAFLKNALGDDLQPFATLFYGLQVVKW